MIAHLYISDQSFLYNGSDSTIEVEKKLLEFKKMVDEFSEYDDNEIYLNNEQFADTVILSGGVTIISVLTQRIMDRDCLILFQSLFKRCRECHLPKKDLIERLDSENETQCNGILVLNYQEDLPKNRQVISTITGWLEFRRFYLGKYPGNAEFFLSESRKYFKNLCIHEQNKDRYLKDILYTHSQRIVKYLSALNDYFLAEYKISQWDMVHFLPEFSERHGIDDASFEGKKYKKFKCTFSLQEGTCFEAYCEPHLKMYKDDVGNQNQQGRIYFHAPQKSDVKIYIGFICKHL